MKVKFPNTKIKGKRDYHDHAGTQMDKEKEKEGLKTYSVTVLVRISEYREVEFECESEERAKQLTKSELDDEFGYEGYDILDWQIEVE